MSRLRRLRVILAIVASLCVTGVALAESGTLTIPLLPGPNPGTLGHITISSGLLFSTSNSRDYNPVLSASGMLPGSTVSGSVQIKNTGLLAGLYQLAGYGLTDHAGSGGGTLSSVLHVTIDELTGTVSRRIYDGTLAGLNNHGIVLGIYPGVTGFRTYFFNVTLPSGTTNAYMGASATEQFAWTAVSTP